jgi:hypothetical protein
MRNMSTLSQTADRSISCFQSTILQPTCFEQQPPQQKQGFEVLGISDPSLFVARQGTGLAGHPRWLRY